MVISNGVHEIPAEVVIDKRMRLYSFGNGQYGGLDNAAKTIITRPTANPNHRIIRISHPAVVLDGVTITGGRGRSVPGMGVNMTGGTLLNCMVNTNGATDTSNAGVADGGGIWMNGGLVSNCVVQGNVVPEGNGVGVYAKGDARVVNSQILDNTQSATYAKSGGGIYAADSSVLIQNCLVGRNSTRTSGGGIYGGTIANCTVVSNVVTLAGGAGGGVYLASGSTISNSIAYFNRSAGTHTNLNTTTGAAFSCFWGPDDTSHGNISDDPLFVDLAGGDYRLADLSPCINSGNSAIISWATDLDGQRRIAGRAVDMGAYELQPPSGMVIMVR